VQENIIDLEDSNTSSNYTTSSSYNKGEIQFNKNTIELAHTRLGHISLKAIKRLKQSTKGVDFINLEDVGSASTSLDKCNNMYTS
jgi:hypothetical protein